MTIKTDLVSWLAQLRVISSAVNVVAVETGDAATIHNALHKVIALHSVLVGGTIRVVKEVRGFSERVVFQFPVIRQPQSNVVADRPVVILTFDRI